MLLEANDDLLLLTPPSLEVPIVGQSDVPQDIERAKLAEEIHKFSCNELKRNFHERGRALLDVVLSLPDQFYYYTGLISRPSNKETSLFTTYEISKSERRKVLIGETRHILRKNRRISLFEDLCDLINLFIKNSLGRVLDYMDTGIMTQTLASLQLGGVLEIIRLAHEKNMTNLAKRFSEMSFKDVEGFKRIADGVFPVLLKRLILRTVLMGCEWHFYLIPNEHKFDTPKVDLKAISSSQIDISLKLDEDGKHIEFDFKGTSLSIHDSHRILMEDSEGKSNLIGVSGVIDEFLSIPSRNLVKEGHQLVLACARLGRTSPYQFWQYPEKMVHEWWPTQVAGPNDTLIVSRDTTEEQIIRQASNPAHSACLKMQLQSLDLKFIFGVLGIRAHHFFGQRSKMRAFHAGVWSDIVKNKKALFNAWWFDKNHYKFAFPMARQVLGLKRDENLYLSEISPDLYDENDVFVQVKTKKMFEVRSVGPIEPELLLANEIPVPNNVSDYYNPVSSSVEGKSESRALSGRMFF